MPRASTPNLLTSRRTRFVLSHPDDSALHAPLQASQYTSYVDLALLTRGEQGKQPKHINRVQQEKAAASVLGIQAIQLYNGRDGRVNRQVKRLARAIGRDAVHDDIQVLVSSVLSDHTDHLAAGEVAIRAGQYALRRGHDIAVLLLRDDYQGEYLAENTPETLQQAFRALRYHEGQFRMHDGVHADWPITAGGYSMHPDDLDELLRYPQLQGDNVTYTHLAGAALAVATIDDVTAMRYTNTEVYA